MFYFNFTVFFFSYYKCSKFHSHFCPGSVKKLEDGTIEIVKPHIGHDREQNNSQLLVKAFCEVLKRRASTENNKLKDVYDDESRR